MSKKMDPVAVLECLKDIYKTSQETTVIPVSLYMRNHKIGSYMLTVLIEGGILKKLSKGNYLWASIPPNMKMAEKVIVNTSIKNKQVQQRHFKELEEKSSLEPVNKIQAFPHDAAPDNNFATQLQMASDVLESPQTLSERIEKLPQPTETVVPKRKNEIRKRKEENHKSFSILWGAISLKW